MLLLVQRRYSWSSTSTGRRASFRARNRGQRGFSENIRFVLGERITCFSRDIRVIEVLLHVLGNFVTRIDKLRSQNRDLTCRTSGDLERD